MAVTNVTLMPEVVKYGSAYEDYFSFVDDEVISEGDLIRVNNNGEINLADATAASGRCLSGMALEDGTDGAAAIKVLIFGSDTVLKIATADSTDPATNFGVGVNYEMDGAVATKKWALATSTTNPVFQVVGLVQTAQPWHDAYSTWTGASTVDNSYILVRPLQSVLDATGIA